MKTILEGIQLELTIERLAYQILEENPVADDTVFIGIQPRGTLFSDRLVPVLNRLYGKQVAYGQLDITFYRDDINAKLHLPNQTHINFSIDKKNVVLVDDVLYTGRTIRSAMDALIDFGRPQKVELCVLVDRRFNRELPIQPDFTGRTIDTIFSQRVVVNWSPAQLKDEVLLADSEA